MKGVDLSPQSGFLHSFGQREVFVRRWNKSSGLFELVDSLVNENIRSEQNLKSLDPSMAPYPYDSYKRWCGLSNNITSTDLTRLVPECGFIDAIVDYEAKVHLLRDKQTFLTPFFRFRLTTETDVRKLTRKGYRYWQCGLSLRLDMSNVTGKSGGRSTAPRENGPVTLKTHPGSSHPSSINWPSMGCWPIFNSLILPLSLVRLVTLKYDPHLESILLV